MDIFIKGLLEKRDTLNVIIQDHQYLSVRPRLAVQRL